jgi:hypothetical protein
MDTGDADTFSRLSESSDATLWPSLPAPSTSLLPLRLDGALLDLLGALTRFVSSCELTEADAAESPV